MIADVLASVRVGFCFKALFCLLMLVVVVFVQHGLSLSVVKSCRQLAGRMLLQLWMFQLRHVKPHCFVSFFLSSPTQTRSLELAVCCPRIPQRPLLACLGGFGGSRYRNLS